MGSNVFRIVGLENVKTNGELQMNTSIYTYSSGHAEHGLDSELDPL